MKEYKDSKTKRLFSVSFLKISLLSFLMTLMLCITVFARGQDKNTGSVNSASGSGNRGKVNFTVMSYRYDDGLSKEDIVYAIDENNTARVTSMTMEQYITRLWSVNSNLRRQYSLEKLKKLLFEEADVVWLLIHKQHTQARGTPVLINHNTNRKGLTEWIEFNGSGGAEIEKMKNEAYSKASNKQKLLFLAYIKKDPCMSGAEVDNEGKPCGVAKSLTTTTDTGWLSCDVGSGPQYVYSGTTQTNSSITGVTHTITTLTPQKPKGFSSLSKIQQEYWKKTHKEQIVGPTATPYGEYLSQNVALLKTLKNFDKNSGVGKSSDYRVAWDNFEQGARAAIAQGVPETDIMLEEAEDGDLTENGNIEGFARGGVYTVTEYRKSLTISTTHFQDLYTEYHCVREYAGSYCQSYNERGSCTRRESIYKWVRREKSHNRIINGEYTTQEIDIANSVNDEDNPPDKNNPHGGTTIIIPNNYKPFVSYQILSVRCNKEGFERVVKNTASSVAGLSNGQSAAISPKKTGGSIATYFNHLDVDFFYGNKDCQKVFSCTAKRDSGLGNDINNNIQDTGNNTGTYGAQVVSENMSSDSFSFFRDNISKEIRNDIWYPTPTANIDEYSISNKGASATMLVLDKNGTPNKKGLFTLEDKTQNTILTGEQIASGNVRKLFNSQENRFYWRASWASEKANPHRFNIRYAYEPKIISEVPESITREGVDTWFDDTYVLNMYCDVLPNTTNVSTPIINNLPMPDDYNTEINKMLLDPLKAFKVNFVKSSAE